MGLDQEYNGAHKSMGLVFKSYGSMKRLGVKIQESGVQALTTPQHLLLYIL